MKKANLLSLLPNDVKMLREDTIINGFKFAKGTPQYELAMVMTDGMFITGAEAFANLVRLQMTGKITSEAILNMLDATKEDFEKLKKKGKNEI